MVDLPATSALDDYEDSYDHVDMTASVREELKEKRLLLLKVDYLRECHTVHSRKAYSERSIREVCRPDDSPYLHANLTSLTL